jgi:iron complex outermembrane receptor protein
MMLAGTLGPQTTSIALAQEARLEEVIVTARKRTENLMDIPESVTAISSLAIERQNIKGLNKIGLGRP